MAAASWCRSYVVPFPKSSGVPPNAVHCPCFNHALNLSLPKSSRVQAVRNAVGIMKEIISFFTASPKRNIVLKNALGHQLKGLCETRWVERHDSVIQFRDSLGCVSTAPDAIASWREMQSAAKAKALSVSLGDGEFLMAIVCLSDLLAHTLPLSRLRKKGCVDVHTARNTLTDTIAVLTAQRQNCEEVFRPLYEQAVALADELDTEAPSHHEEADSQVQPPCARSGELLQDVGLHSIIG
ncbi:unnamed protein product [Ixodes pacificus]